MKADYSAAYLIISFIMLAPIFHMSRIYSQASKKSHLCKRMLSWLNFMLPLDSYFFLMIIDCCQASIILQGMLPSLCLIHYLPVQNSFIILSFFVFAQ